MMKYSLLGIALLAGCGSTQQPSVADPSLSTNASFPSDSYVQTRSIVVLAPRDNAKETNRLDAGQKVTVYEFRGNWARISDWYDGAAEGESGQVARWLLIDQLGPQRPAPVSQPSWPVDPRIQGLPRVGQGGLTKREVALLYAASQFYLESGTATRVEYGDKSVTRDGVYYLNFGGNSNHFFRESDIPNLDVRIRELLSP